MGDVGLAVVIDNGSGFMKAGMASDEDPSTVFPSVVRRQMYREHRIAFHGQSYSGFVKLKNPRVLVGDELKLFNPDHRDKMTYPIEQGVITNWEDMERLWTYSFRKTLAVTAYDDFDRPVLLSETPLGRRADREQMAEVMFETYKMPALLVKSDAELSLYSSGRASGAVMDSGSAITSIVPIYEGSTVSDAVNSIDFAGRDITYFLMKLLSERGYSLNGSRTSKIDRIRDMKEKSAYVSLNFRSDLDSGLIKPSRSYVLPDGNTIPPGSDLFRCSEILFSPSMIGKESDGIHRGVVDSILKCKADIRGLLFENIVLAGGSTMLEGLPQRLMKEMKAIVPDNIVKIVDPPDRKYATWIGGSIIASLSTFAEMCVRRDQYNEEGPRILYDK